MTLRRVHREGFTLIELLVVLTVSALLMGAGGLTLGSYLGRSAARRAAQLFAQDLTQARALAVRGQERVVVRFSEGTLRYEIASVETGTVFVQRRFASSDGVDLEGIDLLLAGDSVVFDRRGFADLSGATGTLGRAEFRSGAAVYAVAFNSMGASRVEAP